jgi:hypothetical protein
LFIRGGSRRTTKDFVPGILVPVHDEAFTKANERAAISNSRGLRLRLDNRNLVLFVLQIAFTALVTFLAILLALGFASSCGTKLGGAAIKFLFV